MTHHPTSQQWWTQQQHPLSTHSCSNGVCVCVCVCQSADIKSLAPPPPHQPLPPQHTHSGWKLSHILNTHHHWDHTGANLELKQRHNATIIGPRADAERIPGIDLQVGDGDTIPLGAITLRVYDTPGHTKGHISIYLPDVAIPDMPNATGALFCGDTLFAMGCGRLFEGTPAQMWASLSKLVVALPPTTAVYCAHEYTKSNARFALHVDGGNDALQRRAAAVDAARAAVCVCVFWVCICIPLCVHACFFSLYTNMFPHTHAAHPGATHCALYVGRGITNQPLFEAQCTWHSETFWYACDVCGVWRGR